MLLSDYDLQRHLFKNSIHSHNSRPLGWTQTPNRTDQACQKLKYRARAEFLLCDVLSLHVFLFFFFFIFQFHVMTLTLTWRCGPKTYTSLFTLLFFFPALLNTPSNVQKALLDLCQVTSSYLQLVLSLESSSSFSRAANCPNVCTLTLSRLLFNSSNSSLTIKSKSIHLPLACRASFAWPQCPLLFTLLPLSTSLLFRWLNMPCSRSPPFSSLDLDFSSITFACFTLSHSDGRGGEETFFKKYTFKRRLQEIRIVLSMLRLQYSWKDVSYIW